MTGTTTIPQTQVPSGSFLKNMWRNTYWHVFSYEISFIWELQSQGRNFVLIYIIIKMNIQNLKIPVLKLSFEKYYYGCSNILF